MPTPTSARSTIEATTSAADAQPPRRQVFLAVDREAHRIGRADALLFLRRLRAREAYSGIVDVVGHRQHGISCDVRCGLPPAC
jgi:hypothetical protein